jgi:hypothetical protein
MKNKALLFGMALAALVALPAVAQNAPTPGAGEGTTAAGEQVYGWQLMSPQERAAYRSHMTGLKTAQEREQFRLEHQKQMEERARERGVTLQHEPMGRGPAGTPGQGMGPGAGTGPGTGPGGGSGGGGGPNR